jgi:enterochelin esterase-like enzyme
VLHHDELRTAYPHLRFTSDPWGRGAMGCSSGGLASLSMAYFRPSLVRRVAAYSPSVVNLQCPTDPAAARYPMGAWEYHDHMRLLQTAVEPLRVFVANNEFDLGWSGNCPPSVQTSQEEFELGCWATWDCNPPARGTCTDRNHSWSDAGNRTAAALRAASYEYQHVYALGQHHCAISDDPHNNIWSQTVADTLVWLWRGYQPVGRGT